MKDSKTKVAITRKEKALLYLIRSTRNGVIEKIVIRGGEPENITATTQRIDLLREDEIERVLGGGAVVVDMGDESAKALYEPSSDPS